MQQNGARRALVTGGSRGIGEGIALALAAQGVDVAITYERAADRANAVTDAIKAMGRQSISIQADSADPAAIVHGVSAAVESLGGLDILVNNAAIGRAGTVEDISLDDLQAMLDVNVRGPILFAQAVIPHLSAGGRIIFIGSSLVDRVPFPGVTAYAASKSALLSLTKGLSREIGPRGITANLVCPGAIDTEMNPASSDHAHVIEGLTSLGRFGEPQEIGVLVAFLASPAASLINGAVFTADAGLNA